ncbi:MAG: tetratricopeptide repeat protein [Streptomyces sp.]|nr:tetratricopeptide repeat protein [Streptomyces sp.]
MIRKRPEAQAQPPQLHADRGAIVASGNVIASVTQNIEAEQAYVLPPEAHAPIPADAPGTAGIANIPRHTSTFVGRRPELDELAQRFTTPAEVLVQAVQGLGGVGKSTLAAEWAAGRPEPVRWWITADTEPAVGAGVASLARALQPALAALPVEVQTERAIRWLAENPDQWLLILDNVENPAHIRPLLDRIPGRRVLITTRLASGQYAHATVLRLGVLTADDAATLFTRILTQHGPRDVPAADIDTLCAELGHLALAVEQAAAYCAETGVAPRTYLDHIRSAPTTMYAAVAEGGDPARTVARIWRLTLDRIATTPLAGNLLRILAWYAPDDIPRDLLYPVAPAPEVDAALGKLAAYSMIGIGPDDTLSVHRLVQAVARTADGHDPDDPGDPHRRAGDIDAARDTAADLLARAFPADPRDPGNWPRCRQLLPHADALVSQHSPTLDTVDTAVVLSLASTYRRGQGSASLALETSRRALTALERVLGPDHPGTLTARNRVADAYETSGDLEAAIALYEENLDDYERVLGPDHPDTLAARNNLALAYSEAGDPESAIPLYKTTLTDYERVLGPDHPDTLTSRNNLADAHNEAGDPERAIPLHETTLTDRERVLGPDHPSTLNSRNNLAVAHCNAGYPERAIPLYEKALHAYERVLGPDHPGTLTARNNLAHAHGEAGDTEVATLQYEDILRDRERVLGPDHPDTLISRNNLALAYGNAGELERALSLFETTLARAEGALSPGHPITNGVRENLAYLRSL